jgi:hypothetical protein
MFSAHVHVVLIPNINEYCAAGLATHLWWNEDDYKAFKHDALEELRSFMDCKEIASTKEALKEIYQAEVSSSPCNDKHTQRNDISIGTPTAE